MFLVLNRTKEKFLDFRVDRCESLFFFSIRVVDPDINTRWNDIKLRVKNIYSMDNSVQSRHCEGCITLILSNSFLADNNINPQLGPRTKN